MHLFSGAGERAAFTLIDSTEDRITTVAITVFYLTSQLQYSLPIIRHIPQVLPYTHVYILWRAESTI